MCIYGKVIINIKILHLLSYSEATILKYSLSFVISISIISS